MLQAKELKVGLFVWWSWSAQDVWPRPCIVTAIDRKKGFKVRSLDSFHETNWLRLKDAPGSDKSSLHEMRECSREEVARYIEKRYQELHDTIDTAESEVLVAQNSLVAYKEKVNKFWPQ